MMNNLTITTFEIKNNKDVLRLQSELKNNFEVQHIAQEFAKNMIDDNEEGIIVIEEDKITSSIDLFDDEKEEKINNAIIQAKCNYQNGQTDSISNGKKNGSRRGRGLISILCLGWDLHLEKTPQSILLTALKT